MKKRRINISIVTDAVPSLIQIVQDYVNRFPVDASQKAAAGVKTEDGPKPTKGKARTISEKENIPQRTMKHGGLVVSDSPSPAKQTVANKSYSFEVVNGEQNGFVRITEYIGTNKKSTFHVPLEGCMAWKDAVGIFFFYDF